MQTIMSLFIYFFCIISTVIFVGIASKAKCKKASFLFLSFAILLPSIMAGLRQNVGTDYNQYLQIYSTVAGGGNFLAFRLNEIEAGFMLLNKICIFFWRRLSQRFICCTIHYPDVYYCFSLEGKKKHKSCLGNFYLYDELLSKILKYCPPEYRHIYMHICIYLSCG